MVRARALSVATAGPSGCQGWPGRHLKSRSLGQVVEAPGAAKCIGPGCGRVAQPDSVYCSSACILKHAAATMKFLSSGKDQKPKPKEKVRTKSEKLSLPKWSVQVSVPGSPQVARQPHRHGHLLAKGQAGQ